MIKYPNKERGEAVVNFLRSHPLISRNGLCTMVGYDTSNLDKAFSGARPIPAKYLDEFERVLSTYGFTPLK